MVDFNGSGGLAGFNPFGGMATGPAMSAGQINAGMGMGPGGAGSIYQSGLDAIFNNFGKQTDYYSALGAAYGRNTGGFGGYGDIYGVGNPSGTVTSGGDMPGYQLDPTPDVGSGWSQYYEANPDVAKSGMDPATHWKQYGQYEGRDPFGQGGSAQPFKEYLDNNLDVARSGMNPLQHWEQYGQSEGRSPFGMDKLVGREQLASQIWQGTNSNTGAPPLTGPGGSSNAPPYQGNPYYLPGPMPGGGQATQGGGGFGAPGFGIGQTNYTGQPGFGLGIGQVGPGSVGDAYGVKKDGGLGYGFGGLEGGQSPFVNLPGS